MQWAQIDYLNLYIVAVSAKYDFSLAQQTRGSSGITARSMLKLQRKLKIYREN